MKGANIVLNDSLTSGTGETSVRSPVVDGSGTLTVGASTGIRPAASLRRDSSAAYLLRLQDEFTVNKLQFSSLGIFGREKEMETLLRVFGRVIANNSPNSSRSIAAPTMEPTEAPTPIGSEDQNAQSAPLRELVWIQGMSGSGKSRLVDETLNEAARRRRALYIRGKFDMNNQRGGSMEPYSAIAAACGELCGQILSYTSTQNPRTGNRHRQQSASLAQIREKLADEMGEDQLQTLTRIFPVLEEIVSDERRQAPSTAADTSTPPEEAKNRLNYTFRRFLQIIGSFFPCIVMVLDDMQWCDQASLHLFHVLITDDNNPSLLPIGCYRSDEVDESHPLTKTLLNIGAQGEERGPSDIHTTVIPVEDLSLVEVNSMIMALLDTNENETLTLAQICHKRTRGNPFHLKSFLLLLQDKLLLQFNMGLMKWIWDEAEIEANTQVSGNVVDLMTRRMEEMPQSVQTFFGIAACLGKSFSKKVVETVWENLELDGEDALPSNSLDDILAVSIKEGFMEQTGEHSYRWVHDKIQEAAASLVSAKEFGALQTRIGEMLLSSLHGQELESNVFVAVNLLNQAPAGPCSKRAHYNLTAALKAVELSAIDSAANYAVTGIQCLPEDCWISQRGLALELYSVAAETEGYLGREEAMHSHCEVVLSQDCDLFDKLRVYNVLLDSLAKQSRIPDAFSLCQDVLAELGCKFVKSKLVRTAKTFSGLNKLRRTKAYRTRAELSAAPIMNDPVRLATLKLLEKLATYSYLMSDWSLYFLVVLKEVEMTDRYGLSETASHAFGTAGLLFSAMLGEFQTGSIFGEHATGVTENIKSQSLIAQSNFVVYSFVLHWTQSAHLMMKPLFGAYTAGMRSGNVEYAGYAVHSYLISALQSGRSLDVVEADCRTYTRQMRELKRVHTGVICGLIWQFVLNLMGRGADPLVLTGEALNEERVEGEANPFYFALLGAKRQLLYAIFDRHDLGAKLAIKSGHDLEKAFPGSALVVICHLFRGVSLFAMAQQTRKRKYLRHGMKVLGTVKKWVEKGNPNVRHYEALLEAELAAYRKKTHIAKKNFEVAIALATRGGFVQDAAFAHERYAAFLMHTDPSEAQFRITQAIDLYREWGAHGKVISLREKHADDSEVPSEVACIAPLQSSMQSIT